VATVSDRFNLPVLDFIIQALSERFPDLDVRPGSALYQLVALPLAHSFQPFRDRLSILRKNQSMRFFQFMLPREMDALVANFLMERAPASNANGTVRVFFSAPGNYTVPTSAVFLTDDGREFSPATAVSISLADIQLNFENGLYYVDVPTVANFPGQDGVVQAEEITRFRGVTSAVAVTNRSAFFGGRDEETNAGLAVRARRSIATRTITSPFSTEAVLREQFGDSLISVEVIGFGDEDMLRDRARSFVSYADLFTTTYGRKVNVSINAAGEVDTSTNPPATNRYVGAIIDVRNSYAESNPLLINDPYYFFRLPVNRSGEVVRVAVNRGDVVTLAKTDQSGGPDPDDGSYVVTDIVHQEPFQGHLAGSPPNQVPRTMMLVLDRPFVNPQSTLINTTPGSPDLVEHTYKISSGISTAEFHKGGYVDVYVHTSNTFEDELLVAELFSSQAGADIFDVPVRSETILNPLNQPWYEDGKVFQAPVIGFTRVEQIDLQNSSLVLRELREGQDFIYIPDDPEQRLTVRDRGTLRFFGQGLLGARVRVVYATNSDIQSLEDFLQESTVRDTTKNVVVKAAKPVLVDVSLNYRGSALRDEVEDIVKAYISTRPQGSEITANQLVTVLNSFGVTDITLPMELDSRRIRNDGSIETIVSEDRLTARRLERFVPVARLSITRTGG